MDMNNEVFTKVAFHPELFVISSDTPRFGHQRSERSARQRLKMQAHMKQRGLTHARSSRSRPIARAAVTLDAPQAGSGKQQERVIQKMQRAHHQCCTSVAENMLSNPLTSSHASCIHPMCRSLLRRQHSCPPH